MLKQGVFCFFGLLAAQLAYADDFLFCLENQHLAPFLIGTEEVIQNESGIIPDMFFLIAEKVETTINFERRPWKRCQAELAVGEVDALAAFIFNDDRDRWAAFPKTNGIPDDRYVYQSDYLIYTYPGSDISWDGNTLLPKTAKVQSIPGYVADQRLQAMGFEPVAQVQPNHALQLVARRLVDGFIVDRLVGSTLIKDLGLEGQVVPLEIPFMSQQWYAVFSKQAYAQQPDKIEEFWTALKAVRITHTKMLFERYE